ncbi:MAG: POTRA domain-containing protein [Bdellovibrionales bacterium]
MRVRLKPLLAFLLLFAAAEQAFAAGVSLRELNAKDEDLLRKRLPGLSSGNPDLSTLDEAIRLLMDQGRYENVYVDRKQNGSYEVIGRPLRVVETIQFVGADEVEESQLRDLLEFKIGERFDRKKAVAAGERMKNFYGESGYFNTIIEVSFHKTESNNIKLLYEIQEKVPCTIVSLTFATGNTDLKAKLDRRFSHLVNKPLTTERVRQLMNDLNEFLISNRYLAAEVIGPEASYNEDKTKSFLKFEIENPYRYEFYFSGYKFETLTGIYRAMDLKDKERKNVEPPGEGAERLRRHYLAEGFPHVEVETKVVNPKGTYLNRVYYTIHEGPRVKIQKIEVQGRISRRSEYYEEFILENSSSLVERRSYNRQDLENGFKNLTTELRNQGFLRARVLSSRVEYNDARDKVTVIVLLEEGPQTQIRALDFEGNRFFSSFDLARVTGLQTNTALRLSAFEASIEKLKQFYRSQGFLEMRLLNEGEDLIQYNDKGTQARIAFRIFEGPRIRVNSIVVEGNNFTKSRVILKEADFEVGEVLTPKKIEDATARLNKLGLFSRVDIRTLEEGTNVSARTLVISVSERDPGIFRFGVGVNNERNLTVRGFTGLSHSNIAGTARAVSGRVEVKSNVAEINYLEHEIAAGYLEPFLFNTRTRGRVNITRSEHVFDYETKDEYTAITASNRIDFLAERDLTTHTKLTWKIWGLESRREFERYGRCLPPDPEPGQPAADFDPNQYCPPTTQQIATIGPTLLLDYSDNPFLPTRGSITRLTVDYSHPDFGSSSLIEFVRTEGSYSYYHRLGSPRLVWANSVRGGYVSNLSGRENSGVPTSYAFLLGGIYTVRGFDLASENERIPKEGDDDFVVNRGNQLLIPKDSHYYLFKSELRFPISGDHGGVLFYDGGGVRVTGFHFKHSYRDAAGVGYRYNTPVGPLALDLAFKLHPLPNEKEFRLHLSIGTF